MVSNLYEILNYFIETTSLQHNPPQTRIYRAILLRIIYSIANIDVEKCVRNLLENGTKIGEYNATTTTASLFQGLSTMKISEWIEFIEYVKVPDMSILFTSIQATYQDDIDSSPLWVLKNTFEDNAIYVPHKPSLIVHVFLLLFCREIDSASAMSVLLMKELNSSQTADFSLRVLGRMNSNFSPENISNDLCTILQFMELVNVQELHARLKDTHGIDKTTTDDTPGSIASVETLVCRLSMFELQRRLKKFDLQEQRARTAGTTHALVDMPCDLPIGAEAWGKYSCAQQQVVLLLASVRLDAIDDKDIHVALVVSGRDRLSFTHYTTPKSKCDVVAAAVCVLMLRIGEVVDMHKLAIYTLMGTFVEACFEGVFGSSQLEIMTTVFQLQLYLIAFLAPAMRANCYNIIVAVFNSRISRNKAHMCLPEYIPHTLCTNMDAFSLDNKLPHIIVNQVLNPLCV